MAAANAHELFELSMLGGAIEKRYRRQRPEVERMPWGTLRPQRFSSELVAAARRSWTLSAFQEHRTGAACAATLEALIAARAPVDLIAVAARFPLDELAHVEMCARIAAELGGGVPLVHDANWLIPHPSPSLPPLLRAAELVVRFFCVGEAISIPLLRATAKAATHPLTRAVLQRIAKDEAAHGQFGWIFLDWAADQLGTEDRRHLSQIAREEIAKLEVSWNETKPSAAAATELNALGWMESRPYLDLARASLEREVIAPLRARGFLCAGIHC